ncbi:MAG: sodium:solute symporter family protein, partial [Spirochaetales bacterium]
MEFFLAGRNVPRVLLFFTMAATNFSAFTIFGLSGAGYRMGYAFYPVMGFGTGFMALSMYIIGTRIAKLAGGRGYITPSDFFYDRYQSIWLKRTVSIIMIVFTLPYLSLQAMAAGSSLFSITGIPYVWGALIVTVFVMCYVFLGGMRSVIWTDLIQAVMMIGLTTAGFIIIAAKAGGFTRVHADLFTTLGGHFSRPGTGAPMTPGIWIGYMVLWFVSVPM